MPVRHFARTPHPALARIAMAAATLPLLAGCAWPGRWVVISPPPRLQTHAERTDYAETGRYADAVHFCRWLAAASPDAAYTTFGTSGEGRPLPLLILSTEGAFTPDAARRSDRPLVLIQNCIHAGECCGKDACLALARDIVVTRLHPHALDHVNVLIMPIFNVDGHERFGPYNRINQFGPKEMGWRTTAANYNLNRDYMKAEAVEMRAWLRVWNTWRPDMLIDCHTTDGSDHQYDLTYAASQGPEIAAPLGEWMGTALLPAVLPAVEAAGYPTFPYHWPRDRADLSKGIQVSGSFGPRYSTGYAAACNRPSILLEAHSLKPYRRRVLSIYEFLLHTLETLDSEPGELRRLVRDVDATAAATRGVGPDGTIPVRTGHGETSHPLPYRGRRAETYPSEITGTDVVRYTSDPLDVVVPVYDEVVVERAVKPPAAYLIPPQWRQVIERLDLHAIEHFQLDRPTSLAVDSYKFEDVKFPPKPFEGHFPPAFTAVPTESRREFPAGTVVVPLNQPRARLAVLMLEPECPDSLVGWGLLNVIFEQKEYTETYAMEPKARRMLAEDPALAEAFAKKLADDPEFSSNSRERLYFFYRRSRYYDDRLNRYPIARLEDMGVLERLRPE